MSIKENFINSQIQKTYDNIPENIKTKLFPSDYFEVVQKSKKLLNKKFFVILPSASSPAENNFDYGIGSLNEFVLCVFKLLGFDGLITLPEGPLLRYKENGVRKIDTSPFNPLGGMGEHLARIHRLTEDDWGRILTKEELKALTNKNTSKSVDYSSLDVPVKVLDLAFEKFVLLDSKHFLKKDFKKFISKNDFIEYDAIYYCLSNLYETDDFLDWKGMYDEGKADFDKTIFRELKFGDSEKAKRRLTEIKHKYKDEIERYLFGQFFLYKERERLNQFAKDLDFKILGNLKVAPPLQRFWDHPECFIDGLRMGAPPEPWRNQVTGKVELVEQRWGALVFKPFDTDADELQKKLIWEFFQLNDGGILDHAVKGSLNEYVYDPLEDSIGLGSRLCSSPFNEYLEQYSLVDRNQVDCSIKTYDPDYVKNDELTDELIGKYSYPFANIYLPVLQEMGIEPSNFILETLGVLTNVSAKVFDYVEEKYGFIVMTPFAYSDYSCDHLYNFQNATGLGLTNTHDTETINYRADQMSEEELRTQIDGFLFQTAKTYGAESSSSFEQSLKSGKLTHKDQYKIIKQVEPWLSEKTSAVAISFVELTNGEPINFPGESGIWSEDNPNTKVWKSRMSKDVWQELYAALNSDGYNILSSLAYAVQIRMSE